MRKKIITFVLVFMTLLTLIPLDTFAFSAKDHNAYLRQVLFGNEAVKNTDTLDALNDAVALSIDQHGSDGSEYLTELNDLGIKGLPKSIDEFKGPGGPTHRNYTHKGWNYNYKEEGVDSAKWSSVRKKIILDTVNQEFDFGFWSGKKLLWHKFEYDEQCESFSALIYYVHIIGDHISNTTYHSNYEEIPLIKGNEKYGIIEELEKYSQKLISDTKDNVTYNNYITALEEIKASIQKIYSSQNDLDDPEVYEEYHQYAIDLMDCLIDYMPLLLQKEEFFQKTFYPELLK